MKAVTLEEKETELANLLLDRAKEYIFECATTPEQQMHQLLLYNELMRASKYRVEALAIKQEKTW